MGLSELIESGRSHERANSKAAVVVRHRATSTAEDSDDEKCQLGESLRQRQLVPVGDWDRVVSGLMIVGHRRLAARQGGRVAGPFLDSAPELILLSDKESTAPWS
jgi:hypothetical protein